MFSLAWLIERILLFFRLSQCQNNSNNFIYSVTPHYSLRKCAHAIGSFCKKKLDDSLFCIFHHLIKYCKLDIPIGHASKHLSDSFISYLTIYIFLWILQTNFSILRLRSINYYFYVNYLVKYLFEDITLLIIILLSTR